MANITNGFNVYYVLRRPKNPATNKVVYPNGAITGEFLNYSGSGGQVKEEVWLVHSIHYSLDDAIKRLQECISLVGEENIRVVKVYDHEVFASIK